MAELNEKQKRFVGEYLIDLNATQAAIRAGYSAKTAHVQGSRLLSDARIAAEIAKRQTKVADKLEITAERVIRELALIGFANMLDYIRPQDGGAIVDLSTMTRDQAAALGEVTTEVYMEGAGDEAVPVKRTKIKLLDKRAALVDLGKHLGLFNQPMDEVADGIAALLINARNRAKQTQAQAVH